MVEGQLQVSSAYRGYVACAVLIVSFDAAMYIPYKYFCSFCSAKILVITFLHAKIAYVVSALIIWVTFDIALRHFSQVAEHVGCCRVLVLAQYAFCMKKPG